MIKEKWKWIPGYEGYYKVSDFGRVKRVKDVLYKVRGVNHNTGKGYYRTIKRNSGIISLKNMGGYRYVMLVTENGTKCSRVHTLVLEAFIGPRPKKMECRHLNDVKHDNRLINLKWGTRNQNQKDSFINGRTHRGTKNPSCKLTPKTVAKIRKQLELGIGNKELATKYGVSSTAICWIKTRKNWTHI